MQVRASLGEWFILSPLTRSVGIGCIIIGGSWVAWCIIEFFLVGRGTPAPFDAPKNLVKTGPYQYVRNPMYLGASVILLGFGLWNLSTTMAIFSLAFIGLAYLFIVFYEEPALEREFGADYQKYKMIAGRWLPKRHPKKDI